MRFVRSCHSEAAASVVTGSAVEFLSMRVTRGALGTDLFAMAVVATLCGNGNDGGSLSWRVGEW